MMRSVKELMIFGLPLCLVVLLFVTVVTQPLASKLDTASQTEASLRQTNEALHRRLAITKAGSTEDMALSIGLDWRSADMDNPGDGFQAAVLAALRVERLDVTRYRQRMRPVQDGLARLELDVEIRGSLEGLSRFLAVGAEHPTQFSISEFRVRALPEREQTSDSTLISASLLVWGLATGPDA